ncbi:MAG TPA: cytochrome c, partial [Agriterribacter sp.]|nr:cytochrome c [Agriterribacter sp.]
LLLTLAKKFPDNAFVSDAIISNLEGREASFYKKIMSIDADSNLVINRRFKKTMEDITKNQINRNLKQLKAQFPKGVNLFETICKTCHGEDGNGVTSLAPPLNNSKWVTGDKNKLIAIVLQGLTGAIKVNNKLYEPPEISGEMPGLYSNDEIDDETIAQVLSFIRKNWSNRSGDVSTKEVAKIRKKLNGREKSFTVEELNGW